MSRNKRMAEGEIKKSGWQAEYKDRLHDRDRSTTQKESLIAASFRT